MKKILHVTECYDAGVRHAIRAIVENAPLYSHDLLYFGSEELDGARFRRVTRLPKHLIARVRTVIAALKDDYDLVHLHSSWAGLYGRLAKSRVPVVYQPHCYKFEDPSLGSLGRTVIRSMEKLLLAQTSVTVAVSDREFEVASSLRATSRVELVPNTPSIHREMYNPVQPPRSKVLMIGRLTSQKDPEFFAETANRTRELCPSIEFVWIGDGESRYRDALEKAGVRVTGWLDTGNVAELLQTPGVYLHCAAYEGFPISAIDAAHAGQIVLVRDIPAYNNYPLIKFSDPREAANAIAGCLIAGSRLQKIAMASTQQLATRTSNNAQREALSRLYEKLV